MSLICPNCSSEMNIANKFGVEIDHCPRCKGVWLDRGELEKIASIQDRYEEDHYKKYHYERDHDYNDDDDYNKKRNNKKRGGFLGEMFDFD
ncbi:MAG: zf-TFIIB domain-containing protein [Candidatus Nitrosocosmicus sp.]